MSIIPIVRVRELRPAISFYTQTLDFGLAGGEDEGHADPAFAVLQRGSDRLFISSHTGDGVTGSRVCVLVAEIDALFRKYVQRGLDTSRKPESPVHQGPLDQTWGTREFYVDDPDGNTIRFVQDDAAPKAAVSRDGHDRCLSFLRVPDVARTLAWYQQLGFRCLATHEEPGCAMDWALLDWNGAQFMLYPQPGSDTAGKDAGLYFDVGSLDKIIPVIQREAEIIEINERTEYGKREIVFRDLNGFQVTFGSDEHQDSI